MEEVKVSGFDLPETTDDTTAEMVVLDQSPAEDKNKEEEKVSAEPKAKG